MNHARIGSKLLVGAFALVCIALVYGSPEAAAQEAPEETQPADAEESDDSEEASDDEDASKKANTREPKLFLMDMMTAGEDISDIIPDRVDKGLRTRLDGVSRVDFLPTLQGLGRIGTGAAAVDEAERLYTSGIGLVKAEEGEEAVDVLREAVDILEGNLVYLEDFDVLVDAYKNLAIAYHLAGYDFDAQKTIKIYANLEPGAELDPEDVPEELIDLYDNEVDKVDRAGDGELVIEANKEGATVRIDGETKGETPMTVDDVGYGYHYLVARDSTGNYWADQIRVRGRGKSQELVLELESADEQREERDDEMPAYYTSIVEAVESGSFGEDLEPYLAELFKETGADYIGWVALVKTDESYRAVPFVYGKSDETLYELEPVDFRLDLGDLQVRLRDLSDRLVDSLKELPEDRARDAVELDVEEKDEPSVAAREAGAEGERGDDAGADDDGQDDQQAAADKDDSAESADAVAPPPEPDDQDDGGSNTWMWVGVGSSAVIVTGAIVGGSMLLSNSAGGSSFDAELTW